jgi:hypothetical protein
MSAVIDDKIVARAQDCNVVKEDPIVILTVCNFIFFYQYYCKNMSLILFYCYFYYYFRIMLRNFIFFEIIILKLILYKMQLIKTKMLKKK